MPSELEIAPATSAARLVTGDSDLLDLVEHDGIPILAPWSFWAFEAGFASGGGGQL